MRRRAFTIIELVAVIVILGVMAAVAIPAMSTSTQTRQRSAALMVARDLRYIRDRAMASGRPSWAAINPGTETITYSETVSGSVTSIVDQATGTQMASRLGSGSDAGWYAGTAIGTFNASTTTTTIGFDWQGRPVDSLGALLTTDQTITITAGGMGNIVVTIKPESGQVAITW
jgi:prepilin-type N-terminal cleavage/methylation domain-containing protein